MRRLALLVSLGVWASGAWALEWVTDQGHRRAALPVSAQGKAGFTVVPPELSGVTLTNFLPPERHYTNQILLNGSGGAAGDIDGDGWCDLFFCGLGGRSALYRNLGNWRFTNVTAAAGLDLSRADATGAALADLDGDDDLDLLVNTVGHGTLVFANDGRGRFHPFPGGAVLNPARCGTSLALADADGDGWLDLYIANYRTSTIRDEPLAQFTLRSVGGQPQVVAVGGRPLTEPDLTNRFSFRYRPQPGGGVTIFHEEQGEPDVFFRNVGGRLIPQSWTNGTFQDAHGRPLAGPLFDWGLSVLFRDLNGDGAPDLYVCNDFASPDRFWLNDGRGRFREAPAHALRQLSLSAMGADVADVNGDGLDDIFVVDMLSREHWRRLTQRNEVNPNMLWFHDLATRPQFPRNTLHLARGDGTYAEVAQLAGLEASEWSWQPVFLDVDLDGWTDVLFPNGFARDYMNADAHRRVTQAQVQLGRRAPLMEHLRARAFYPPLPTRNVALRNLGQLRFTDFSAAWGFDLPLISQGMWLADLDNDGDLDAVLNNMNAAASLLRNDTPAPRVAVRLRGRPPNTRGLGAKITLWHGPVPRQSQEMVCGGRFCASDEPLRVFAAGRPEQAARAPALRLEVTWRSGAQTILSNVQANRLYELSEGEAKPAGRTTPVEPIPLFRDLSHLLAHTHPAQPFDDFASQPLLPHKLSTLGPGLAWFDGDGDGWDDLCIAGSGEAPPALLRNQGRSGFAPVGGEPRAGSSPRSQTAVLAWRDPRGTAEWLVGLSSHENTWTHASSVRRYRFGPAQAASGEASPSGIVGLDDAASNLPASPGPLALADVDGDGDLDLFVGGRCVPGRWPEPASSWLYRRTDSQWVLDSTNAPRFAHLGLISGAVFTDLDADGDPDLVLASEWGPLRVFRNGGGAFSQWDWPLRWPAPPLLQPAPAHLRQLTGWWNGVAAGDFDGDGRLDLLASNWGRNSKYESWRARPLQLFYGDFNGDGRVQFFETWFDPQSRQQVPILYLERVAPVMPWVLERFETWESFGRASIQAVLGPRLAGAQVLEAAWLDSTLFLNRGDHFEVRSLPLEAQMAPAFAVCVADFDGDGREDVFLSQNFFGTHPATSRYDAGRGLLLRGDGQGDFAPVPGQQSGLMIYGEQRGAAVGDFDADGRADLAVAQHGGPTVLLRNQSARPGLRVRLRGSVGNPDGVGAVVRLKFGDRLGPAREVHAGSGYWSQDSAVPVLATPEAPTELHVRWPGGRVTVAKLPAGAAEVALDPAGMLDVLR